MKPIKFPEMNHTLMPPEDIAAPETPVLRDPKNGVIVSCWKMSIKERWKALFSGRVWMLTYYHAQPPVQLEVKKHLIKKPK